MRIPPFLQDTARSLGLHDWIYHRDFPFAEYCTTVDHARAMLERHQPPDEAGEPPFAQIAPVIAQVFDIEGALVDRALDCGYAIDSDADWLRICMAAGWVLLKRYAEAIDTGQWCSS